MAVKWYKAEAGEYRAEPTPEGSEFYVRKSHVGTRGSGWIYGVRPDGVEVSRGWAATAAEAKAKAVRPDLRAIVQALHELDFDGMPYELGAAAVLDILRTHRCDWAGFAELDEKPGHHMFKDDAGHYTYDSWHRPLRVVRNDRDQPLAEVLRAGER